MTSEEILKKYGVSKSKNDVVKSGSKSEEILKKYGVSKSAQDVTRSPVYAPTLEEERANERDKMLTPSVSRQAADEPTLGERLKKIATGAAKSSGAGHINALGTLSALSDSYEETKNRMGVTTHADEERAALPKNGGQLATNELYRLADELAAEASADIERAKEGQGTVGKLLTGAGVAGLQMLGDLPFNLAAPGMGLAAMGTRAFGSGAQEARQSGATLGEQIGYGAATGAVEVLTERMFDGLAGIYGGGAADDLVAKFISKHASSPALGRLLSYAASAAGESIEEVVAGVVDPALKGIYNKKSYGENFDPQELLESAIIGGILGLVGGNAMYRNVQGADAADVGSDATDRAIERLTGQQQESAPVAAQGAQESTQSVSRETTAPTQETPHSGAQAQTFARYYEQDVRDMTGELGGKAFVERYDGTQDIAEYTAGFVRYWNAGATGRKIGSVQNTGGLNELQRYAAYYAGQNDAARSTVSEQSGVRDVAINAQRGLSSDDTTARNTAAWSDELRGTVDALGRKLGVRVVVDDTFEGVRANGYYDAKTNEIHLAKDAKNPVLQVVRHEATHRMQQLSPKEYRAFRDYAVRMAGEDAVEEKRQAYSRGSVELSEEEAMDEIAAETAEKLLTDETAIFDFIRENRTAAQKFYDALRSVVQKVKEALGGDQTLAQAERLWKSAFEKADAQAQENAANKNAAQTDGEVRYSINNSFSQELQKWFESGQPDGERFVLGSTGPVLQGLGAIENDIYMNGDKIEAILKKHPEMSVQEIARIPEILEDPTLILKSKGTGKRGSNSRMVLYGSIKAKNGQPVLAVLDLRPSENGFLLDDMQKVNSAYTKNDPAKLVLDSEVLYADKKRTVPLLRQFGLTITSRQLLRNGSIGSISYSGKNVNMSGVPFSSVVDLTDGKKFSLKSDSDYLSAVERGDTETAQKMVDERAKEAGYNTPDLYHGTRAFGFTEFDPRHSDDGVSIFLAGNKKTAGTYTGFDQTRTNADDLVRNPKSPTDTSNKLHNYDAATESLDTLVSEWNKTGVKRGGFTYRVVSEAEIKTEAAAVKPKVEKVTELAKSYRDKGYGGRLNRYFELLSVAERNYTSYAGIFSEAWALQDEMAAADKRVVEQFEQKLGTNYPSLSELTALDAAQNGGTYLRRSGGDVASSVNNGKPTFLSEQSFRSLYAKNAVQDNGIYKVRARLTNPLEIDGEGANWADIKNKAEKLTNLRDSDLRTVAQELGLSVEKSGGIFGRTPVLKGNTRGWSQYAKQNDYDGVIFHNIEDVGQDIEDAASDIYIVFDSTQVKSSEPVTYDENGDVIPLSKRFDTQNKDIRYSLKTDSEGRELSERQQEYFKDSKAVDTDGRLKVMYQGGNGEFTVFDRKKSKGSNLYGRGFYFTDSEAQAKQYGGTRAFYLNVTNPLTPGQNSITRQQMRDFLSAVAENEDYGLENYGYGATVDSVLESVYGKGDFEMLQDVNATAIGDLVAAAELFNEVNGTDYDGIILPTETVTFRSNQAKNVTNAAPTDNADIRYSLRDNSPEAVAAKQQEMIEYLRGQLKRSRGVTTKKGDVAKIARATAKAWDSSADVTERLQAMYDFMANGKDASGNELTWDDLWGEAKSIAGDMLDESMTRNDDLYREYADLRRTVRDTKLNVPKELDGDLDAFGGYGEFRRGEGRALNLSRSEGTGIDDFFQTLADSYPEYFDEAMTSNPADQLARIAEVMNDLKPVYENRFAGDEQAVNYLADELINSFYDARQEAPTFADKAALDKQEAVAKVKNAARDKIQTREAKLRSAYDERIAKMREMNRQKIDERMSKLREQRDKKLEAVKDKYKAKEAKGRERRNASELRGKIIRHSKDLSAKLLKPNDKQHIPERLRVTVAAVLDAINEESAYSIDETTGKRVTDGSGTPTKRTEAFRALRAAFAEIRSNGEADGMTIDPDLEDNLTEIETMRDIPLGNMNVGQLTTVWNTLKAVETAVQNENKAFGAQRFKTISDFAEHIRLDNLMTRERGNSPNKVVNAVDNLLNVDQLTPEAYFRRLGSTGTDVFNMLRRAQDKHITIMQQAQEYTENAVGKTDVYELEKEMHTFTVNGEDVTLSTAQLMSLYELMKRSQALEHLELGGIRATDTGRSGVRRSGRSTPVKPDLNMLLDMTNELTPEQKALADKLQSYMANELSDLGNEASMEVYGYEKFTEENYFPIKVDKNQTKTDVAKEAQSATIAGRGFTKGTKPHANNAVMIDSIFSVFAEHTSDMATYSAWLGAMENLSRIWNFAFYDAESKRVGDVKSIIERSFGKGGNGYMRQLIDNLNNGVRAKDGNSIMDMLTGSYKASAIGANLRVWLQQPTAILRALNEISPADFLAGAKRDKPGTWNKVREYAPIAVWKDWGYFDADTGRQMKDVLFGDSSGLGKLNNALMSPAGKMDSIAWSHLWNALEVETLRTRPELTDGSDAFYKAVAQRFNGVIDRTQVVDGILQRSQIMRSSNGLVKMATSFMSEPTKVYNMFASDLHEARTAQNPQARKAAKVKLARTSAALLASFAANAAAQALVDGLRDDDRERDYWEKFLTSYAKNGLDALNPASYIPIVKDMVSILQGYDVARMDMSAFSALATAAINAGKALEGGGRKSVQNAMIELVNSGARVFGVPAANVKRDLFAVLNTAANETDNYGMQYALYKFLYNPEYPQNKTEVKKILWNAYQNDGAAYDAIYADVVKNNYFATETQTTEENLAAWLKKQEKAATFEGNSGAYYKAAENLRTQYGNLYTLANDKGRKDADDFLVSYYSGDGGATSKTNDKLGVSAEDYASYLLALSVYDEKNKSGNLGTYTNAERESAINATKLSKQAKAWLWTASGGGKNNPFA